MFRMRFSYAHLGGGGTPCKASLLDEGAAGLGVSVGICFSLAGAFADTLVGATLDPLVGLTLEAVTRNMSWISHCVAKVGLFVMISRWSLTPTLVVSSQLLSSILHLFLRWSGFGLRRRTWIVSPRLAVVFSVAASDRVDNCNIAGTAMFTVCSHIAIQEATERRVGLCVL